MINAAKALADLDATPGDIVAVPKAQMKDLLRELASRQPSSSGIAIFGVPQLAGAQ
jgi:hypothetical protein